MLKRILQKQLKDAIKRYYSNRQKSRVYWEAEDAGEEPEFFKWDKETDLDNISAVAKKNRPKINNIVAMAGTFWFRWPGTKATTIHSEKDWWRCKKYKLAGL